MYKKIRNSSFMNLIWFIIALMPILLVFIYSLSFFDNEEKEIIYNNSTYNLLYKENLSFSTYGLEYNSSKNRFDVTDSTAQYMDIDIAPNSICTLSEGTYYIYFITNCDYGIKFAYLNIFDTGNSPQIRITSNFTHIYKYEYLVSSEIDIVGFGFEFGSNNAKASVGDYYGIFMSDKSNLTYEDFIDGQFISISETGVDYVYNSFPDYLIMINSTIQTNGFISNAFLNLSTLFGINNVYYSLACYYVEYLIIIALLHLAFDVLYMLPNICHKFMEKIGGERD